MTLQYTGDSVEVYGVARNRDAFTKELTDFQIGMTEEQAREVYDNFQAYGVLRITIEVLSSVDGVIQQREEDQ